MIVNHFPAQHRRCIYSDHTTTTRKGDRRHTWPATSPLQPQTMHPPSHASQVYGRGTHDSDGQRPPPLQLQTMRPLRIRGNKAVGRRKIPVTSDLLLYTCKPNSDKNKTMLRLSEHRFILVSTSHNWKRMLPTGASLQFWDYSTRLLGSHCTQAVGRRATPVASDLLLYICKPCVYSDDEAPDRWEDWRLRWAATSSFTIPNHCVLSDHTAPERWDTRGRGGRRPPPLQTRTTRPPGSRGHVRNAASRTAYVAGDRLLEY